jgi:predicted nucleic acid-binding protein
LNGTLVDSNVILDIITNDPVWASWSRENLKIRLNNGNLYINAIILAEVSTGFRTVHELEAAVSSIAFRRIDIPWDAAFSAGKAFASYRRQGGNKLSPLPDFFIGAHAEAEGLTLLTRDVNRYRTYFPKVKLISPPSA